MKKIFQTITKAVYSTGDLMPDSVIESKLKCTPSVLANPRCNRILATFLVRYLLGSRRCQVSLAVAGAWVIDSLGQYAEFTSRSDGTLSFNYASWQEERAFNVHRGNVYINDNVLQRSILLWIHVLKFSEQNAFDMEEARHK